MSTPQVQNIDTGVLVKLKHTWMFMSNESLQPCIGLVTNIRQASGMPSSVSYAKVLWENGRHLEHYISDLEKVEQ